MCKLLKVRLKCAIILFLSRRVTRGGGGGGGALACLFSKFKEKCPDFGKKYPD